MEKLQRIILVILVGFLLVGCQSSWDQQVDLSDEERAQIEDRIDETKKLIQDQTRTRRSRKAEPMAYINLARDYVSLGKYKRAERVYKAAIKEGLFSSALHNNLGRLYEEVKEYDKAIEQYGILIDEFAETNYWYDITWAYIKGKNRIEAEKAFNNWQRAFNKTDENTQEALMKLREEEV